jgi:hypothetical protein
MIENPVGLSQLFALLPSPNLLLHKNFVSGSPKIHEIAFDEFRDRPAEGLIDQLTIRAYSPRDSSNSTLCGWLSLGSRGLVRDVK